MTQRQHVDRLPQHCLVPCRSPFIVAKQVRDTEEESERLEGELESLRAELERVEAEGVEGSEGVKRSRGVDDPTM